MDELNRRLTEHLAKTDSSLTSNFLKLIVSKIASIVQTLYDLNPP